MSKLVSELALVYDGLSNLKEPVSWHVLSVIVQSILFDPGMGEQVCAGCGVILAEKLESLEEGRLNTFDKCKIFRTWAPF